MCLDSPLLRTPRYDALNGGIRSANTVEKERDTVSPTAGKKRGESFQGGKKGHSSVFLDTKLALRGLAGRGGEGGRGKKRG